jgi:hypothetical protein
MLRFKRCITIVGSVAFMMAVAVFLLKLRHGSNELYFPTMADFEKIQFDMTEGEVKAILGPPHALTARKSLISPNRAPNNVFVYYGPKDADGISYKFDIEFNATGVCGVSHGIHSEPSMLEKLKDWLKGVLG